MPKSRFPKPDGPLPPAPKRDWGTGSIEARGRGYLARYRSGSQQKSRLCASISEAEAYLAEFYPSRQHGSVSRAALHELVDRWREIALIMEVGKRPAMDDEEVSVRVSTMIREAHAQALVACAGELEKLADG